MLDGQMAVVDDYLEVRPEAEERLRALAAAGRLSDGALVHPDGRVPRLRRDDRAQPADGARARAPPSGASWRSGYLPDMFGHIAQMPQILRLAGFRDAVVWRGVPSQVTKNAFCWEAPDGSTVRAEYLPVGYGNGAALPDDAKALVRRIADHVAEVGRLPDRRPAAA